MLWVGVGDGILFLQCTYANKYKMFIFRNSMHSKSKEMNKLHFAAALSSTVLRI